MKRNWAGVIRAAAIAGLLAVTGAAVAGAAPVCARVFAERDEALAAWLAPAGTPANEQAMLLGETPAEINAARRSIMKDLRADPAKLGERALALAETVRGSVRPGEILLGLDVLLLLKPEIFAETLAQVVKGPLAHGALPWTHADVRTQFASRAVGLLKADAVPAGLRGRWLVVLAGSPILREHLAEAPNAARGLLSTLQALHAAGFESLPAKEGPALRSLGLAWITPRLRAALGETPAVSDYPETDWAFSRVLALEIARWLRPTNPGSAAEFAALAERLRVVGEQHPEYFDERVKALFAEFNVP